MQEFSGGGEGYLTTTRVISRTSAIDSDYKYGFYTDIDSDFAPKGINEDIVRLISEKKDEPEWMLDWRLRAYRHWAKQGERGADLGEGGVRPHRLRGHLLLRRSEVEERR